MTSKGQTRLPSSFEAGQATWGDRSFTLYLNPHIFDLSFTNNALPRVTYRNWWRRVFVLYDALDTGHKLAFVEDSPMKVQGDPVPISIRRVMGELPKNERALIYGTLRGLNRDHGKVFSWIPRPKVNEPNQLLLVILHN